IGLTEVVVQLAQRRCRHAILSRHPQALAQLLWKGEMGMIEKSRLRKWLLILNFAENIIDTIETGAAHDSHRLNGFCARHEFSVPKIGAYGNILVSWRRY